MNNKYKMYVVSIVCIVLFVLIFQFLFFRIPQVFELSLNKDLYNHGKWINNEPEILLLGSSHCNHNINPQIVEQLNNLSAGTVANMGQDAATPFEMYQSYVKNEKKFSHVKVVYCTLEPWIFSEKYYRYKPYEQIYLSLFQWIHISKEYSDIRNMYFFPSKIFKAAYISEGKPGHNQGFVPLEHHEFKDISPDNLKTWFEPMSVFPFSQFEIEYLNKLKILVESEGKTFIIVLTPAHSSWFESYRNLGYIDRALINKINNTIKNVKVIGSLNPEKYGLNYEDFADDNHLARSGAEKFTMAEFCDINKHLQVENDVLKPLYSY